MSLSMRSKQSGLTTLGWLVTLCLFAFVLKVGFTMAPAYMENRYVQVALKNLAVDNEDVSEMTKTEIRKQINNFLTINSVRGEASKNFKIKQKRDRTLVTNNYEVREHMFLNIYVVMRFENQLDSSNAEACCEYLVKNEEDKKTPE